MTVPRWFRGCPTVSRTRPASRRPWFLTSTVGDLCEEFADASRPPVMAQTARPRPTRAVREEAPERSNVSAAAVPAPVAVFSGRGAVRRITERATGAVYADCPAWFGVAIERPCWA
jgi:hypothetical protein